MQAKDFELGDTVYLKTDTNKDCPMVIGGRNMQENTAQCYYMHNNIPTMLNIHYPALQK